MTEKEQKREAKTEKIIQNLLANGYTKSEKTIGMVVANFVSIFICLPFMLLDGYLFFIKNGKTWFQLSNTELLLVMLLLIAAIVIHELIHGLFMGIFAGWKWDDVEFGFSVKTLTPYCTCQAPISVGQYIVTLLMPTIVLGFIPGIAAMLTGSSMIFEFSLFMILGGGGDFLITALLLVYKRTGQEMFIIDHPTKCGFYAFEK